MPPQKKKAASVAIVQCPHSPMSAALLIVFKDGTHEVRCPTRQGCDCFDPARPELLQAHLRPPSRGHRRPSARGNSQRQRRPPPPPSSPPAG